MGAKYVPFYQLTERQQHEAAKFFRKHEKTKHIGPLMVEFYNDNGQVEFYTTNDNIVA